MLCIFAILGYNCKMQKVKVLSSKIIYKGKWLTLRCDYIIKPDGTRAVHEIIERRNCVLIIPKQGDKYYMVKMYRYPVNSESWEFPQGFINEGENPKQSAIREVEEETGFCPKTCKKLGFIWTWAGLLRQKMYIFLSNDYTLGTSKLDETEKDLQLSQFSYDEIIKMVKEGKIQNSATLAALTLYKS